MILSDRRPSAAEAASLRSVTGWGAVDEAALARSLAASPHCLSAWDGARLIGMVRTVGDGVMYLYVQDLIVDPAHRGQGIAEALMERLMRTIRAEAPAGLTVGLMAVAGLEPFYARHGFAARPEGRYGAGMTLFL
ncbi:ribosomal protein S18 acetylase RimI-like enzyme [Rubricella aquisinus]|uniref:Ribosomal protein S18 acetylase RimI-like enzyme n=1 Tax=Rubricella aquisinus TaxID=2028108 RepID=A0A840X3E9_9RHOB|nr:GNAT family N-acetyltransferase [Rubricella aquisinus]MBB5515197.1 ribosomal protein S18 acetylase RimI-like enzyme [Rubricella aquisinus]